MTEDITLKEYLDENRDLFDEIHIDGKTYGNWENKIEKLKPFHNYIVTSYKTKKFRNRPALLHTLVIQDPNPDFTFMEKLFSKGDDYEEV